jgi:chitodextrinase
LTIELSWFDATDNIGVTGYLLYCNGEEIADIRETSYIHENLPEGEYIYTVKAYDAFYNLSSESNQVFCDNVAPTAPSNLLIESKTYESVVLKWEASTDNVEIKGYNIYRNGKVIGTTVDTVFENINIEPRLYEYEVRALDVSDNISKPSNLVVYDNYSPSRPENLMVSSKTDTQINLTWNASTDNKAVAGYKVFCNDVETALVTETNYTYYLNQGEKDMSFFVKAYDEEGNESEKSNILIFENVPPEKPSDLKVVKRKHNSIQLSWSPSEDNVGVVLYYVYLDSEFMGETDKTTYTVTGLSADTQYTFSVRAIDGSANISEESSISSMTLISPVYLKSDTVLDGDRVYEGDLYIQGGTIDLNGYKLEVKGELIQTGGTMYINGGQLEVEGDYRIENNGEFCICISEDGE